MTVNFNSNYLEIKAQLVLPPPVDEVTQKGLRICVLVASLIG